MSIMEQPQHMRALDRANRVRLARAELKRQVREGECTVASVVDGMPWEAESMTLGDLLMAQHRWGRRRTVRFLHRTRLTEAKVLGTLTQRQRTELIVHLEAGTSQPGY